MSDLIDRQAAIDAAYKVIERDKSGNNDVVKAMQAWLQYIEKLPSAQPERKTGKWMQISPSGICECSECGAYILADAMDNYKYCFNCGARMEVNDGTD